MKNFEAAGGKKRFEELLDSFFGYGQPPVVQVSAVGLREITPIGRFEGFNNEPDMEAPYAYIFCGRHDKACEVIDAGLRYMFSGGRGGIPGNNDSGGLSSCYVWNMAGIFPAAGQNRMLIGSPHLKRTTFALANGRTFTVETEGFSEEAIYVKEARLNGRKLHGFGCGVGDMMAGGTLTLVMDGR